VVGILTFTDVRRLEPTLIGALAAMAFALPVLQNALPLAGCFCGLNSRSFWRLRCWSSNGRKPVLALS
jgi:hypothetical protein